MRFTRVEALGNDFVALDGLTDPAPTEAAARLDSFTELVRRMCDRERGVGADGVLVLGPPNDPDAADFRMRIFNADGAEAEMSGNGLRCAAVLAHARLKKTRMRIQTGAGVRGVELRINTQGRIDSAIADMGAPALDLSAIGVVEGRLDAAVPAHAVFVSMGNPHLVTFIDEAPDESKLALTGAELERHPAFPERINIEFVQVLSPTRARVLPWERGVGFTLASGTGACAALAAGALTGRLQRDAEIESPGGSLRVRWDEASGRVFLDGPATIVSEGDWPL